METVSSLTSILFIIGMYLLRLFTFLDPGDALCDVQCFCLTKLKKIIKKKKKKIKFGQFNNNNAAFCAYFY